MSSPKRALISDDPLDCVSIPPSLALVYYDGQGRAEISRLLLALGGIKYEDKRLTDAQIADFKSESPTGQVPVLQINGVCVPQSSAIEKYLAKLVGVYPDDLRDALITDVIREHFADAIADVFKATFATEDKREDAIKHFKVEVAPKYSSRFEKLLLDNAGGTGWVIGDTLSYADIVLFYWVDYLNLFVGADALDGFAVLKSHHDRVAAVPALKTYLETRPKTDY